jgi:hypothetical protein
MNKKCLPHIIAVGTFAVFIVLGLACASAPPPKNPVTKNLYNEIGKETFSQFLFFISQNVVLTKADRNISTDARATVVTTTVQRNIINLLASTSGRVQGNPSAERLEIGFEKLPDGTIPTFSFVQKKGDGMYYFEQNSSGYIEYGGEYYTVTYSGNNEPYLLYQSLVRESTTARNMGGLN